LQEVLEGLHPQPGDVMVDGTVGGGGHAAALARQVVPRGRVLGIDLDAHALELARPQVEGLPVELIHASYTELPRILAAYQLEEVAGIVLDLGLSSDQLADAQRGFSFQAEGTLDLRFDTDRGYPAYQLLGRLGERELANLIYELGEERFSRRIARRIVETRRRQPIETATELARLVRGCIPSRKGRGGIDPATRTFQALRIAVNGELDNLRSALERLPDCLRHGGRLAIISFHSLEDRLVKHAFRDDARLSVVSKRPITPSDEELAANPRARSAKLRIAERGAD
jgi:16S rRNA (cytosine1402-N4)-methyltransferase